MNPNTMLFKILSTGCFYFLLGYILGSLWTPCFYFILGYIFDLNFYKKELNEIEQRRNRLE